MHPETLFSASGKLAIAGWAVLVFAPRWRWSQRIAWVIIPCTLAILYLALIVFYFAKSPGDFGTLAQVNQLFQNPWLLLAGWILCCSHLCSAPSVSSYFGLFVPC